MMTPSTVGVMLSVAIAERRGIDWGATEYEMVDGPAETSSLHYVRCNASKRHKFVQTLMCFPILSIASLPGRVKADVSTFAGSLTKLVTWPRQPAADAVKSPKNSDILLSTPNPKGGVDNHVIGQSGFQQSADTDRMKEYFVQISAMPS